MVLQPLRMRLDDTLLIFRGIRQSSIEKKDVRWLTLTLLHFSFSCSIGVVVSRYDNEGPVEDPPPQ